MSIAAKLDAELKDAMRARDQARLGCIRSVRAKVQEAVNAKGFTGEADDALYVKVIGSYVKSLQKAIDEMKGAGAVADKYRAEIAYLQPYLPQALDEGATRALVQKTIADLGVTDAKQSGRVMGAIMKDHKDEVDAALVKRLVSEALGG